jgi:hypothetical protein
MVRDMSDSEISKGAGTDWVLALLPGCVLGFYAWLIWKAYSKNLNWDLSYRAPESGLAPEDVLGLGFVLPWIFIALLFLFALFIALSRIKRRLHFSVLLIALFALLSGLDLYLYEKLERYVLGG